jgi:hypothetical protein
MRVRLVLGMVLLSMSLVGLRGAEAQVQESGRIGLSMGYPGSIGVLWHVADRVAVRPELAFSFATSTSELDVPLLGDDERSSSTTAVDVGAAVLFYLAPDGALRTYVSPRFVYSGNTAANLVDALDVDSSRWQLSGSFGAKYSLGERFAVFGETGLGVTRSSATTELLTLRSESRTTNLRLHSGAGVILYF